MLPGVVDAATAAKVATLTNAGWTPAGATRVVRAGVRVGLAVSALRLAESRYPRAGGAAERFALYLVLPLDG